MALYVVIAFEIQRHSSKSDNKSIGNVRTRKQTKLDFDQERKSKDLLEEKEVMAGETARECVAHCGDLAFYLQCWQAAYGCHER